jgi:hypothetical protein
MNENEDRRMEDTVTLPKVEPETVVPDLSDSLPPSAPTQSVEKKKEGLNTIKIIAIVIMAISIGISAFYIFFYNPKEESSEPPIEQVENKTTVEEKTVVEDNATEANATEANETNETNETVNETIEDNETLE